MSGRKSADKTVTTAKFEPLKADFYEPSADLVARRLLGQWVVRQTPSGHCVAAIVETEAYLINDPACHAFKGETARNRVMWGPAGRCYVYFIYGNHWCFNVVCRPAGTAEAVLIRAVEPVAGEEWMRTRRPVDKREQLSNGPGKLCEALAIGRDMNGVNLCDAKSPVFIARNPEWQSFLKIHGPLATTTRVGIVKAAAMPLRFYLRGSKFVSRI